MDYTFSDKISSLQPSAIREILKATADPKIIPLAAGNPAPDAFPVEEVRAIAADILDSADGGSNIYVDGIAGANVGTLLPVDSLQLVKGLIDIVIF